MPRRRNDLADNNYKDPFTFASSKNPTTNTQDYELWAAKLSGHSSGHNSGAWALRGAAFDRYNRDDEDFRWLIRTDGGDSGTPSPPLWKQAGSPVSLSAPNSPVSRAREIEKYRKEMIEMVKDMPENGYELSLRDMVESPSPRIAKMEERRLVRVPESRTEKKREVERVNAKQNSKQKSKKFSKSESRIEVVGDLLLKVLAPRAVSGARRKAVAAAAGTTSAKVSPRPSFAEAERNGGYSTDGDWWSKNERSGSSGSSSSDSSNGSAIERIRKMKGCYSFLFRRQAKEI